MARKARARTPARSPKKGAARRSSRRVTKRATLGPRKTPGRRALHAARNGEPQSAAERERLRTWAYEQIDAFVRQAGMAPERVVDEDGWRWFEQGSATGFAFVDEVDGEVYVQIAAGVMPLPADRDLIVPLMRELLELNTSILGSARFGIRNRRVHATVSAKVADLAAADLGVLINEVMALADAVDDDLAKKYGGTSKPRKQG